MFSFSILWTAAAAFPGVLFRFPCLHAPIKFRWCSVVAVKSKLFPSSPKMGVLFTAIVALFWFGLGAVWSLYAWPSPGLKVLPSVFCFRGAGLFPSAPLDSSSLAGLCVGRSLPFVVFWSKRVSVD